MRKPEDAPIIMDLAQIPEARRTASVDITLCPHEIEALQTEADSRGVTLEDYVRWKLVTATETVLSGR